MSGAFGKFRNTPPRVSNDAWAARTADCGREVKSQYRWEVDKILDKIRARMGSAYFEFVSTRRETRETKTEGIFSKFFPKNT